MRQKAIFKCGFIRKRNVKVVKLITAIITVFLSISILAGCEEEDPYENDRNSGSVNLLNKAVMFCADDFKGQFESEFEEIYRGVSYIVQIRPETSSK